MHSGLSRSCGCWSLFLTTSVVAFSVERAAGEATHSRPNKMSYFGQGTTSSPRIILNFCQPFPELGLKKGSRQQAVFKIINGIFKCDECDEKFITGEDLVKHCKVLHKKAFAVDWKREPHAEVRTSGKMQEEGKEALVIGIDPEILMDGSLDVETLFGHEAYVALQLESDETESNVAKLDPDSETIFTKELDSEDIMQNIFPCGWSGCYKTYISRKHMKEHREIHINPKMCSYCKTNFPSNSKRIRHEVSHTKTQSENILNNFPCIWPDCDKSYPAAKQMKRHMGIHTNHKECSFCEKIFSSNFKKYRHEATHTGKELDKDCIKLYSDSETIITKKQLNSVKNMKFRFCCSWPDCDKSYPKRKILKTHKEIHINPKECSHCKKIFSSNFKRSKHEVLHTDKKELEPKVNNIAVNEQSNVYSKECSYCKKSFPSNSKRKRHEAKHTGHKSEMCQECGKSFSSKGNLSKHQKVHMGHKNHGCSMCDEAFYQFSDLKRHLLIHTKDKPFACQNCYATFADAGALKRHQMKSHTMLQNDQTVK